MEDPELGGWVGAGVLLIALILSVDILIPYTPKWVVAGLGSVVILLIMLWGASLEPFSV